MAIPRCCRARDRWTRWRAGRGASPCHHGGQLPQPFLGIILSDDGASPQFAGAQAAVLDFLVSLGATRAVLVAELVNAHPARTSTTLLLGLRGFPVIAHG